VESTRAASRNKLETAASERIAGTNREGLRIPLTPVIVVTVLVGNVLALGGTLGSLSVTATLAGIFLWAAGAAAWFLERAKPPLGRWLIIMSLTGLIVLSHSVLGLAGASALLVMPALLSAVLIGFPAAVATALGETGLLLLLLGGSGEGTDWAAAGVSLLAIWATMAILWAAHRTTEQLTDAAKRKIQTAEALVEEMRSTRAEHKLTLADLAHANRELHLINQKLAAARVAAETAERVKATFVANVSHELRTPLNLIIGFSEMITQAPKTYGNSLPPALLADLAVILRNAQHLSSLIDDVLDLSQIEAGKMALAKERVAIPEIVGAAKAAVARLLASKQLYLETEVPSDLPLVFCDRTRVREVLLNLLSNAARFTDEGGVRVRVWQEGDEAVVSVADTGVGIASEHASQIFRPFQQLDGSIRRRQGGSGLGLAISKGFIELHGGQMWFESEKGQGTTFYFRLPIDPPFSVGSPAGRWLSAEWEYEQRTRSSLAPMPDVRPRLILLDPGRTLQHLFERHLDGVEVVPVASLEAARAQLARLPAQLLLVNGDSVSESLHTLEVSGTLPPTTPAIVCSVPDALHAVETLGVADYLVKPVSYEQLLAALDRLNLQGKTLLVVDDEPEALRLFWRMLASAERDYRVLTASDGQRALSILREQHPDALLLDLVMPDMDGFRLLEVRNQDPVLRRIPVVILSAQDPMGQPIVTGGLAITQAGGLAMHHLLAYVEATQKIFGGVQVAVPPSQGTRID
jgi:signal transduction histidine kinase/DNA-binding response OmpR family regulator